MTSPRRFRRIPRRVRVETERETRRVPKKTLLRLLRLPLEDTEEEEEEVRKKHHPKTKTRQRQLLQQNDREKKTGLWIKRRKNTSPESRSDYRVHHCLSRAVAVAVAVDDGTEGVGKRNKESLRWNTSVRKVRAKCARTAGACPREAMIRKGRFGTDWNP